MTCALPVCTMLSRAVLQPMSRVFQPDAHPAYPPHKTVRLNKRQKQPKRTEDNQMYNEKINQSSRQQSSEGRTPSRRPPARWAHPPLPIPQRVL